MAFEIRQVDYSDSLFRPFFEEAEEEEALFLFRLKDEWLSGQLRFEAEGEILLGAFMGAELVGVAGISHDPYNPEPGLGRVRHVYVLKQWRRRGIARRLMERLVHHATGRFFALRLATQRPEAARLYECLGFIRRDRPKESYRLTL